MSAVGFEDERGRAVVRQKVVEVELTGGRCAGPMAGDGRVDRKCAVEIDGRIGGALIIDIFDSGVVASSDRELGDVIFLNQSLVGTVDCRKIQRIIRCPIVVLDPCGSAKPPVTPKFASISSNWMPPLEG